MGLRIRTRRLLCAVTSAALIAVSIAKSAEAALLATVVGAVAVDHGDGFRPALAGSALAPGDRVRTADGSADILYDNGCSVRVEQHQVQVVLSATPQCDGAGQKDVRSDTISTGTLFIVGGLAAGGGVALALINTGKQAPASP